MVRVSDAVDEVATERVRIGWWLRASAEAADTGGRPEVAEALRGIAHLLVLANHDPINRPWALAPIEVPAEPACGGPRIEHGLGFRCDHNGCPNRATHAESVPGWDPALVCTEHCKGEKS